jgi:acetylornithine deacetylase/succinyl-diaminopimelate desuccinylase-like protein
VSNRLLNLAWAAEGLSPPEKLILVNLADRANLQNESFPGHRLIANETGLSERTVRDTLPKIATKGHLTIRSEAHRANKNESRFVYIVHPKTPESASRATQERVSTVTPENGARDTGKRPFPHRKNSVPTPENGARHITIENQINPKGNQVPGKATLSVSDRISLENELSEVKDEIKAIAANYEGLQSWTPGDIGRSRALKARKKEILHKLDRMA